ncbi:redoxin domain-containing protein [Bacillus alkalicola]|uniref:Redoxin domain-containing protein n=2 Tax=Bacillales TaxID=1385 RepID=A0ABS6JUE7_9BACI|nr:redoxin domain-containing protein [Bacillus alkalicola]
MNKHGYEKNIITVEELQKYPRTFEATLGDIAPIFEAESYVNGSIKKIRLDQFRGSWLILFFYGSDFTFV